MLYRSYKGTKISGKVLRTRYTELQTETDAFTTIVFLRQKPEILKSRTFLQTAKITNANV